MSTDRIRKIVREVLKEASKDPHYEERLYDRFLNRDQHIVGYEIEGTRGKYREVGTYVLPDLIKSQILENAKLIEDYNFPKNKSYGVQLANIIIDRNRVQYFDPQSKAEAQGKSLIFVDETTESNGNLIFAIIRENIIKTIYFAKSYVPQDTSKLRVDAIIKKMALIRQGKVR
jgi:hypothetical protein